MLGVNNASATGGWPGSVASPVQEAHFSAEAGELVTAAGGARSACYHRLPVEDHRGSACASGKAVLRSPASCGVALSPGPHPEELFWGRAGCQPGSDVPVSIATEM